MKLLNELINAEVQEKNFKWLVIIALVIILMLVILVFLNLGMMQNYKIPEGMETKNNGKVEYRIDSILAGTKFIEIQGWAYKAGKNIGYFDNRYIIRNEETHEYKVLNTQMKMEDEFFSVDGKYDCRRAGMYSKSLAIGLKKGLYQIFIEYKNDNENILVETGIFFNYGM